MDIETRQKFEEWAATQDMDLKPGRCTMGEPQYANCDTDFAWAAWKEQEQRIRALERELEEARKILDAAGKAAESKG